VLQSVAFCGVAELSSVTRNPFLVFRFVPFCSISATQAGAHRPWQPTQYCGGVQNVSAFSIFLQDSLIALQPTAV
jgi:hypothetical protein